MSFIELDIAPVTVVDAANVTGSYTVGDQIDVQHATDVDYFIQVTDNNVGAGGAITAIVVAFQVSGENNPATANFADVLSESSGTLSLFELTYTPSGGISNNDTFVVNASARGLWVRPRIKVSGGGASSTITIKAIRRRD